MGAHSRQRRALLSAAPGRHRGDLAPLIDADLSAVAGRTAVGLATAGAAGAVVVTGAGSAIAAPTARSAATYAAPTASQLAALRQCESGGNYAINTGNGFYGAYQFDQGTWSGLGYAGRPDQASPATQDEAATRLEESRGWQPWPACSQKLGLSSSGGAARLNTFRSGTATALGAALPSRTLSRGTGTSTAQSHLVVATAAPDFDGTTLTTALVSQQRSDVQAWQARMAARGWPITVDGYFGPQSASIAREFVAEKQLTAPDGAVDATVWQSAWTLPVT